MLNKVRIHQFFYFILSLFLIFFTHQNGLFMITDFNPTITILFLIIMSFGVLHGAADSIIIWKTFPKIKIKVIAFLIYLSIVILGLLLWFQIPLVGLTILLVMSIIHFGQSDLLYLSRATQNIKISWGFVMTLLPVIFFEKDVKSIFDVLVNFDINLNVFIALKIVTIIFIFSFLFFIYINKDIPKNDKFFLVLEFLITLILASFLHGLRALINIGIKSTGDFLFLIFFTSPVTFFSYFILFEGFQIQYLNIIFSVLMALTISHMLLPSLNRLLLKSA